MRALLRDRASHVLLWSALIVAAASSGGHTVVQAQVSGLRWDGLIELISSKYDYPPPSMPPTPADGPSQMSRHAISGDGRYTVFIANAPALGYHGSAVYLRDRRMGDTRLLVGGSSTSFRDAAISMNGRHVAFTVCEPYMRPDYAPICDVWSYDTLWMMWTPLTVAPSGEFGNGDSSEPVLSRNGRFVAFRTSATNLIPGTAFAASQIAVLDRDTDANGVLDEPGTTAFEIASAPDGVPGTVGGNGPSETAEISDDGRYIAFRSAATDLVADDTNNVWDVFRRDRQSQQTRRLNLRPWPVGANESPMAIDSPAISMTPDGRFVAFTSEDPMLAPAAIDDYNNVRDVFVFDAEIPQLQRLDIGWGPPVANGYVPGNGPTEWPTLSIDGRYVSVQSSATNVQMPGIPGSIHTYVVDRIDGNVTRVSLKPDGTEPDRDTVRPSISADGTVVTYLSQAFNLAPNVTTEFDRVYAAVHFAITPAEQFVAGSAGGTAAYEVATQEHTLWWLDWNSWQPWFSFDTTPMAVGNGTVSVRTTEANPNPAPRSAPIRIFDKTAVLTQLAGLSLTSVSPAIGPATGGTQVTLTGTGFEPSMRVVFNGIDALATHFVDSTTLLAMTPPHPPGSVYVGVFEPWPGTQVAWIDAGFRYTDTTPPQLWYGFNETPNEEGWFRTNVTIGWAWWDPETPITSTSGCEMREFTTDTAGTTVTCSATSEGGTSSLSAFLKRDATPPTAAITSPQFTIYDIGEVVEPAFTCSDALSGVASCTGSPNGVDTSTPGYKTYWVSITDRAGNPGFASVDYAVGSGVCAYPLPDLIGWWRMEGNTSNMRSSLTTPATRVGLTSDVYADAIVGQGYQFQGANGYLLTGFSPTIFNDKKFALAAWVKPSANTQGTILRQRELFSVARLANGSIAWAFRKFNVPGLTYRDTGVKIPLNRWSHVLVMLDGTTVRTYLNGRLAHTETNIGDVYDPSSYEVTIGGADNNTDYFKGVLDELQIFQHGLTDPQIEQLFLAGNAGACVPKRTSFQIVEPIPASFGSPTYAFDVRLVDEAGMPVAGRTVELISQVGAWPYSTSTANRVTDADGRIHWDAPLKNAPRGLFESFAYATFTGDIDYVRTSAAPDVLVGKGTPVITWPAPAPITYSFPVNSTQLNATANVPGTFSYSPPSGSLLPAGTRILSVTFTPNDAANYNTATATNTLTVNKAVPNVVIEAAGTWPYTGSPRAAVGKVKDRFNNVIATPTLTYNGAPDPPVMPGTYTVNASFPGNANYEAGSATATLTITKSTVGIQINVQDVTYDGQPHPAGWLITGIHPDFPPADSVTYNGSTDNPVNAGSYTVVVTFNGSEIYEPATATATFVIHKAAPTVAVTGGTFTYDGAPHAASGSVTGGGGTSLGAPVFAYNGAPDVPVNAGTYSVTGTFAGDVNHHAASGSATITINKATPVLSVAGGTYTYDGQPHPATGTVTGVGGVQLAGLAFTYNGSPEPPVNAGGYVVVGTYPGDANYEPVVRNTVVQINRAAATVTVTGGTFAYDGEPHPATASATGVGGVDLGAPTLTYDGAASVPVNAGAYVAVAVFAGDANHEYAAGSALITISKAVPVVVVNGGTFTYDGQPHAATGSVTGVGGVDLGPLTFTYGGAPEAPVNAGSYTALGAYAGSANYAAASREASLTIGKASSTVSVTGGTFTYDTLVHPATGTVTGAGGVSLGAPGFTYNGSANPPATVGVYEVVGTFAGDANHDASTGTATITIQKAAAALSWSEPAAIVYGTALGAPQLNATASVDGTFAYSPVAGSVLNAGAAQTLTVTFTPADPANYSGGSTSVTIDVSKATPAVAVTGGTFSYDGQAHPATGSVTGVGGASLGTPAFTYNGASQAPVNAGSYEVVASFAGNGNYESASATATITIGKVPAVLSWNQPAAIVYGTGLGAAQLNATSNVPGTFVYSPGAGVVLNAGNHSLAATFTPADAINYTGGPIGTTIAVAPAPLAIRANDAAKPFGAPLPAFTASAAGFVNGDTFASLTGTLGFGTSATSQSPVGTYPVAAAGLGSSNYAITYLNGTLSVVRGGVTLSVATSPSPSGLNQLMTFTANVAAAAPAAGAPGGTVRFFDGATLLGSSALSFGSASLTTAGLTAGVHTIEARYDGDASFEGGTGSSSHTVNSASATPGITVTSNRNPATVGQSVRLTATLSMTAGPVTGSVQFYDGGTLLGTSAISSGAASFTTTAFAAGSHAITVRYLGSASAPPVRSGVFVQAVGLSTWKNRTTSMTVSAAPNPSALGSSVTVTANVTGSSGTPTGAILFMVNGEVVGSPVTVTAISGSTARATLVLPGPAGGRHTVTATYLGNSNYKGSTAAVVQTVN